jgi:hypothetical protein
VYGGGVSGGVVASGIDVAPENCFLGIPSCSGGPSNRRFPSSLFWIPTPDPNYFTYTLFKTKNLRASIGKIAHDYAGASIDLLASPVTLASTEVSNMKAFNLRDIVELELTCINCGGPESVKIPPPKEKPEHVCTKGRPVVPGTEIVSMDEMLAIAEAIQKAKVGQKFNLMFLVSET